MEGRSIVDLRKAIKAVEKKRYTSRLKPEMAEAKERLRSLERIERLRLAILDMDSATMAEIRNYRDPPPLVHEVMVASLLLLGENEGRTRVRMVHVYVYMFAINSTSNVQPVNYHKCI